MLWTLNEEAMARLIISRSETVVGIITRKDLLPESVDEQFEGGLGQYTTDGTALLSSAAAGPATPGTAVNGGLSSAAHVELGPRHNGRSRRSSTEGTERKGAGLNGTC